MKKKIIIAVAVALAVGFFAIITLGKKKVLNNENEYVATNGWPGDKRPSERLHKDLIDRKSATLSRPLAMLIIDEYCASHPKNELTFNDGGFQQAVQDGIIEKSPRFPHPHVFTASAKRLAADVNANEELSPVLLGTPIISLTQGLGQRVEKITGISDGHIESVKLVQCLVGYEIPWPAIKLRDYVFTGANENFILQRYDDGWRVAKKR